MGFWSNSKRRIEGGCRYVIGGLEVSNEEVILLDLTRSYTWICLRTLEKIDIFPKKML